MLEQSLDAALQKRIQQQLYRQREVFQPNEACLSFVSNDYLGLNRHPTVLDAAKQAINQYGIASGGSPVVSGQTAIHQQLEDALAEFTGLPSIMLFSSGYIANVGIVSALAKSNCTLFVDREIHASLVDGCLLSRARICRYTHLNANKLESRLQQLNEKSKWIITDGVFSADGQIAPLPELMALTKQYDAKILLDDAHGIGCLGKKGQGTIEHHNILPGNSLILTASFAKAFGTAGAFVAGNKNIIDYLIQFARPYMFSNGLSPTIAAATLASLKVMQQESWRRIYLQELIHYFQTSVKQLNLAIPISNSPLQTLLIGDSEKAMAAKVALSAKKIAVAALRPPTVKKHHDCLRIAITAHHTKSQLDQLIETLAELI